MNRRFGKMVEVSVEVEVDEVIDGLSDDDLRELGLARTDDSAQHHEALFTAVERGDCTAAFAAAEQIAWAMYGRILTGKVAA